MTMARVTLGGDDLPMDGRKASHDVRDGKQTCADRQL